MKKGRVISIAIIMVLLMIIVKFGYGYLANSYMQESSKGDINLEKAKDFTVYDEENNEVKLSDYIGKKNVVVNFWASWCTPCKAEMPYFNEAMKTYKDENVEFLMVNLTDGMRETKEKAKEFIKEAGYDMDIVYDLDADAVMTYYLNAVPRTLFIDIEGNIQYDNIGIITYDMLNSNIENLIK